MARPTYIEYEERCRRQRATILELQAEIERLKAKVRVHQDAHVALDSQMRTILLQGEEIAALRERLDASSEETNERLRAALKKLRASIRGADGKIVAIGGRGGPMKRVKIIHADEEAEEALA